ncbi:MAG: ankyrin repeat domain-containing protein [Mariprofundaceae bacterium]|nr:ankyrin repeat domain-containing protein [Mariprofundaceae bacterium]
MTVGHDRWRATGPVAVLLMAAVWFACLPSAQAASPSSLDTELARAVKADDLEKARDLIARGANANADMGGMGLLMGARSAGMVKLLAGAGADVNAVSPLLETTPLTLAAMNGNVAVARALIESGADVNFVNEKSGATALQMAISQGKVEAARALIESGADVNAGRYLGMPPLHLAASAGRTEIAKLLIAAGADLNARDDTGATPLEKAVHMRRKKIVEALVAAGADVNSKSSGGTSAKKGKRESGGGATVMDLASATGDPGIMETLRKAGAKEGGKPPLLNMDAENPPGTYRLQCSIHDPPPTSAQGVSCSKEGQVVASGTEKVVASSIFYEGGRPVPKKEGCVVDLGLPGKYVVRTWRSTMKWRQVCNYHLRGVGFESWLVGVKKDKPENSESEYTITVGGEAKRPREKDEKEPPSIRIVKPAAGEQFAFDASAPGVLEFEAEAVVEGDCDSAAAWKVEDVAGSKKRLTPEGASDTVKVRYEGLPPRNDAFGEKRIMASACGKSDSVTVEVFFPPKAKNHPGKGNGETPNWFYYWGQTSAGKGFSPVYKESEACGSKAVGAYSFDGNKIYLFSGLYDGVCFERDDGKVAKGIDCYGETLIHESIHQQELGYWWNNVPNADPGLMNYFVHNWNFILTDGPKPSSCTTGVWELLERRFRNWIASVDSDGDLVPDYIEKALAGCDPHNAFSCPGVPANVMARARSIGHKIDVDMNTYRISWKKWKIGSADKEDWSRCGKQWKDRSTCSP